MKKGDDRVPKKDKGRYYVLLAPLAQKNSAKPTFVKDIVPSPVLRTRFFLYNHNTNYN